MYNKNDQNMKKSFWIEDKSPKQYFAFIKEDYPEASFWDIFSDYNPILIESENRSEAWLTQQKELVDTIINTYLTDEAMDRNEIELFLDTLTMFNYPKEEQYFDGIDVKYVPLAKEIYQTHLASLGLNDATFDYFIYQLHIALEKHNHEHLIASGKAEMIKTLASLPHYSEEKKQEIIKNYLQITEGYEDEPYEDDSEEDDFEAREDIIYPQVCLAFSDTFFGIDDAGNIPYKKQEHIASEKYERFKAEITELLGQPPNPDLQPKPTSSFDDAQWNAYFAFAEANPQAYEFDERFAIWNDTYRVLYLSMAKEDKETPYEIKLGGMPLEDYEVLIKAYHCIFNT